MNNEVLDQGISTRTTIRRLKQAVEVCERITTEVLHLKNIDTCPTILFYRGLIIDGKLLGKETTARILDIIRADLSQKLSDAERTFKELK